MLTGRVQPSGPERSGRALAAAATASTRFLCFLGAVLLSAGPVVWVLGTLNGDEVSVEGGSLRIAAQLVVAAAFARVSIGRRSASPSGDRPVGGGPNEASAR